MLESRSSYGYYGSAGGFTGESRQEIHSTRMTYREYKQKWSDHKTVPGSYDSREKTIEVIFSAEEMAKKTNLGNRYHLDRYLFKFGGVERGFQYVIEFNAKTYENAKKNARAYARQFGYTLEGDATYDEYYAQFKH